MTEIIDTIEDGLVPLEEGQVELGGVMLSDYRPILLEGLEDISDLDGDDQDLAGDGVYVGFQRLKPLQINATFDLREGGTGPSPETAAATAAALKAMRMALRPLPYSPATRLLRWRLQGEPAKRLRVKGSGKPFAVSGDQKRRIFDNPEVTVRLEAPNPVATSDLLHTYEFAADETAVIPNAGDYTARYPVAWSLAADTGVTLSHVDFAAEVFSVPAGPVTVNPDLEVIGPGTYGVCYGAGGNWLPNPPLLRPADNHIYASAACTFSWRDT